MSLQKQMGRGYGLHPLWMRDKGLSAETLLVLLILALTFIPYLGLNLFSTKGEPREAIVAMSMLDNGDWILPRTYGVDIPYKPPMLAWCISVCSFLWSELTEFAGRLPSALSVVIMLVAMFRTVGHRQSIYRGALTAFIAAGCLEVFRSATICRVDMLLTMFIVTAILAMFTHWDVHREGYSTPSWLGALLISGAILTKGPIGMIIPVGVMFIFRLLRGDKFWNVVTSLALTSLISFVLPALWYIAAYRQGGDEFLQLVMEENFGRFTGSMSYSSHEHSVLYNFTSLLSGFAPYTLLALMGLFSCPWRRIHLKDWGWGNILRRIRRADTLTVLSWVAVIFVFIFYSIPKSKRSVYLLPMYPFLAYLMVSYIRLLIHTAPRIVKAYCGVICAIGGIASLAVMAAMWSPVGTMEIGAKNAPIIEALHEAGRGFVAPAVCIILFVATIWLARAIKKHRPGSVILWTSIYTLVIYWMAQGAVLPAAMNYKSDRYEAGIMEQYTRQPEMPLYSYQPDPLARFFTVNYYLNDKLQLFKPGLPAGYVMLPQREEQQFLATYSAEYELKKVRTISKLGGESKSPTVVYSFTNAKQNAPGAEPESGKPEGAEQ